MSDATRETLLWWMKRENRRWKILGTAAIAALGLALLIGATTKKFADEIRANRFVLVGRDGKDRARLSEEPDGEVRLVLMDEDGKARAGLSVGADGLPELTLYDANHKKLVRLRAHSHGWSILEFHATDTEGKASMGMVGDGPSLVLTEKDGISLTLMGKGFGILDKNYNTFAELSLTPNGSPALTFSDKDGAVIWKAP